MDLRLTFDTDVESYEALRPRYSAEMYRHIINYCGLNCQKDALEIGIGSGQATLPFLRTGCKVRAIELGTNMASYVADKFSDFDNFEVVRSAFEDYVEENQSYDFIYAASSFHWIDPCLGLNKVLGLLKPGGSFAWITLFAMPMSSPSNILVHEEIQSVYRAYDRYFPNNATEGNIQGRMARAKKRQKQIMSWLDQYGFVACESVFFDNVRRLSSDDYRRLISTYSDHKSIPEKDRIPFLQKIKEAIDLQGGYFELEDQILLCIGKKAEKCEDRKKEESNE